jgi:hypothetical protein
VRAHLESCRPISRAHGAAMLLIRLAGCVGPHFRRPEAPNTESYAPSPLASETASTPDVAGGESQHFAGASDIRRQWWTLFQSAALIQAATQYQQTVLTG